MLKMNALRDTLADTCRWCKANPDKFTVCVESGSIETTGESPSFLYRYNLVIFAMDFTQDIDELFLPLLHWLYHNQPDLLLNPEKNSSIKFSAAPNNDDSVDVVIELPVWERVRVTRTPDRQVRAEHLQEPRPRIPSARGAWSNVYEDVTWSIPRDE
ncbi:phage tail protein [Escherichia coli]